MADTRFTQLIPWYVLKQHLEQRLDQVNNAWLTAKDTDELRVNQGKALLLRELLSLPETLQTISDEDERVAINGTGAFALKP